MPPHLKSPLAYHITWGTYGTRLHGDPRGTVERKMNTYGDPIIDRDDEWKSEKSTRLRFPPRILSTDQRLFIEDAIPAICVRGHWHLASAAAAPDHIHVLLSADADGKAVRKWLKRWAGEALTERWPLVEGQVWWAECGSVKWILDEDYFQRATNYVQKQRTTR